MQTSITPNFSLVFHTNKLGLFTYAHLFYRKTHNIDPWPTVQSLPGKTRNPKPGTRFSPCHSHLTHTYPFWMLINAPIYILSKDIKQSKALSSYFLNFYQPSTGSRLFKLILHISVYTGTSSPGYRNVPYRMLWASHRFLLLKINSNSA